MAFGRQPGSAALGHCWGIPGQVLESGRCPGAADGCGALPVGVMGNPGPGGACGADPCPHPFLDGPGGVPAGFSAEAARGAQGGGEGVSKPEGEMGPAPVPSEEVGLEPPQSLLAQWLHPGEPFPGTPPCAHHRAEPAHASPSTAAARLSVLEPCPRGLSLCRERGSGTMALSQQLLGVTRRCGARTVVWKGHLCPSLERAGQIGIPWWDKRTLLNGLVVEVSSKGGLWNRAGDW